MKEMIGGCCVCSDERGWAENPLVYCDGHGCSVAVHQGKHPTARRGAPAFAQRSPPPQPGPQPSAPLPRAAAAGGTRRVRARARGVWAAHVGESACGPDCHVIPLSLKCHSAAACAWGRGLLTRRGGAGRRPRPRDPGWLGAGGGRRAPLLGSLGPWGVGLGEWSALLSGLPPPVCRSVCRLPVAWRRARELGARAGRPGVASPL